MFTMFTMFMMSNMISLVIFQDREIVMLSTERGTLHRSSDQAGSFEETKLHSGQRQALRVPKTRLT